MSEYIVTCDEEAASWIGNEVDSMKPIVLCRDCEFEMNEECSRIDEWLDELWFPIEPDGFCAWGKKKVDE